MKITVARLFALIVSLFIFSVSAQGGGEKATSTQSNDDKYNILCKVAREFLSDSKEAYISESAKEKFNAFTKDYDGGKESTISLDGLSARSRIWLLRQIIDYKFSKMSKGMRTVIKDKPSTILYKYKVPQKNSKFWEKRGKPEYRQNLKYKNVHEFYDRLPTTFTIGKYSYKLELSAEWSESIGSGGRLYGILGDIKIPDSYRYLSIYINDLKLSESVRDFISNKLLQQKIDGEPVVVRNKEKKVIEKLSTFLNGFNLLLDYEVARHLKEDDKYNELPLLAFLPALTDLDNFTKMIYKGYVPNSNKLKTSLMTGTDRCKEAKNFVEFLNYNKSELLTRYALRSLHNSDEDSGDEYSVGVHERDEKDYISGEKGREFDRVIKKFDGQEIDNEEVKKFLKDVVKKYIARIRQDGFWGGDIELGIIANIFKVKINVYSPYSEKPLIVGEDDTNGEIDLWLEGKHYFCYNSETGKATSVKPDGNCLYSAVIKQLCEGGVIESEGDVEERAQYPSTIGDLRTEVANRLERDVARKKQIRGLFSSLFEAENGKQLSEAIFDLPPGELLEEALSILSITGIKPSFFESFY